MAANLDYRATRAVEVFRGWCDRIVGVSESVCQGNSWRRVAEGHCRALVKNPGCPLPAALLQAYIVGTIRTGRF